MQNAKDSFYMALRTRLTTINPERTILLRGAVRLSRSRCVTKGEKAGSSQKTCVNIAAGGVAV